MIVYKQSQSTTKRVRVEAKRLETKICIETRGEERDPDAVNGSVEMDVSEFDASTCQFPVLCWRAF